jgi:GR25 family glycosyltransferase involved in LPS biosynthesis
MEVLKNVLYINLDHRTDRLDHVKFELEKIGIRDPIRFPAVKMPAGNVGCTISHIRCLEIAKKNQWPAVFICEDDITFTQPDVLLNSLKKMVESGIEWDVLVIGGNNCPPFIQTTEFCARVMNVQTTTGYIVKKEYYDILYDNFKEGLDKLIREPEKKKLFSIDIYWKELQKTGRWYMLLPLTVVQYYDYSDIEEKVTDYRGMMLDFDKKALIERLMREQQQEAEKKKLFKMSNFHS